MGKKGFNKWWMGGESRRLHENVTNALSDGLEDHQVAFRFKDAAPYPVDHELVEKMVRFGYFMKIDDDDVAEKGPLEITSFYLDYDSDSVNLDELETQDTQSVSHSYFTVLQGLGITAGLACVAALVMFRRRDTSNHWRGFKIEIDEASDASGLE